MIALTTEYMYLRASERLLEPLNSVWNYKNTVHTYSMLVRPNEFAAGGVGWGGGRRRRRGEETSARHGARGRARQSTGGGARRAPRCGGPGCTAAGARAGRGPWRSGARTPPTSSPAPPRTSASAAHKSHMALALVTRTRYSTTINAMLLVPWSRAVASRSATSPPSECPIICKCCLYCI